MKNDNSVPPGNIPRSFKVNRPLAFAIWMAVMIFGFLFFTILEVKEKDYFSALCFSLGLLFFLLMGLISFASLSDIVISDDGISRIAFGRVWKVLHWPNVAIIKVFAPYNRIEGKSSRAFNIYPVVKPKFSITGKVVFGERMERPKEFIELMNIYIDKYHIKIESDVGGIKTSPVRL